MKLKKLFSGLTAGVAMTAVLAAPQISQAEKVRGDGSCHESYTRDA